MKFPVDPHAPKVETFHGWEADRPSTWCDGYGTFVREVMGVHGPYEMVAGECSGCPACRPLIVWRP